MSWSRSVFPTDYASGYAWALCIVELWSSFSRNSCWWIHEERWLWMISSSRNRWTSWRRSSSSGLQSRGEGHLVQQLNRKSQPRSLDQAAHRGLTHHGSSTLTSQSRHQPAKESMRLSTIKGKLQNFGGPGALGVPLLVWPSELMYLFIEVQPAVQGTNCIITSWLPSKDPARNLGISSKLRPQRGTASGPIGPKPYDEFTHRMPRKHRQSRPAGQGKSDGARAC